MVTTEEVEYSLVIVGDNHLDYRRNLNAELKLQKRTIDSLVKNSDIAHVINLGDYAREVTQETVDFYVDEMKDLSMILLRGDHDPKARYPQNGLTFGGSTEVFLSIGDYVINAAHNPRELRGRTFGNNKEFENSYLIQVAGHRHPPTTEVHHIMPNKKRHIPREVVKIITEPWMHLRSYTPSHATVNLTQEKGVVTYRGGINRLDLFYGGTITLTTYGPAVSGDEVVFKEVHSSTIKFKRLD